MESHDKSIFHRLFGAFHITPRIVLLYRKDRQGPPNSEQFVLTENLEQGIGVEQSENEQFCGPWTRLIFKSTKITCLATSSPSVRQIFI